MAANNGTVTSSFIGSSSTSNKLHTSRRRKGLLALTAAASAVSVFGLSGMMTAKADVIENQYAQDEFQTDLGVDPTVWVDTGFSAAQIVAGTVDNPAFTQGFSNPSNQDIASFDANSGFDSTGSEPTSSPTFSLVQTGGSAWAGITVWGPGVFSQFVSGTTTSALQVVMTGGLANETLTLGNPTATGSPTGGVSGVPVISVQANLGGLPGTTGGNGLIIQAPLALANSQTWDAGAITATIGTAQVNETSISSSGGIALNGHQLTITGSTYNVGGFTGDGTNGIVSITGAVTDGTTPGGSLVLNLPGQTVPLTSISNTFTGGLTLQAGTVGINNIANLGGVGGSGGGVVFAGGALQITGAQVTSLAGNSINGAAPGAAINGVPLNLTIQNGPTTTEGNIPEFLVTGNGTGLANLTISQNITGASSLTKSGSGTLTLTGVNSFTGGTTLVQGVLAISSFSQLGTSNDVFNTPGTAGSLQLNLNGSTMSYSGTAAGNGGLIANGGTLLLEPSGFSPDLSPGPIANNQYVVTNNGTLTLDYTNTTTPLLALSSSINVSGTAGLITVGGNHLIMNGGTLSVLANANPIGGSGLAADFSASNLTGGNNYISAPAGVTINLGYFNYTTTGAVAVTGGGTITTTQIVANTTAIVNGPGGTSGGGAYPATVVFNGPVTGTVTPFQVYSNNPRTSTVPTLIATPFGINQGNVGTIVTTPSTTTTTFTGSAYSTYFMGFATYGTSDWAVVTPYSNGTSYIAPASATTGFYTVLPASTGLVSQGSNGTNNPINVDIENPGEDRLTAGNHAYNSIRFNSPNGSLWNDGFNNMINLVAGTGLVEGGSFLFTPNIGANNVQITNFTNVGTGVSSTNTQIYDSGRNNDQQYTVFWQNDTQNLVTFTTGFGDAGGVSPAWGGLLKAGPGILVMDASNSYSGATVINAGTYEIPFEPALGALPGGGSDSTSATPQNTLLNTLTLNGGSLVATNSFALDNSGTGAGSLSARNIILGPTPGNNITALGGTVLVVDGNISGVGSISFGNPLPINTAAANNRTAALAFGTNLGVGTVVVTGSNTYTGTTTVVAGTVELDGSFASSQFNVQPGGVLTGHPTVPANSTIVINPSAGLYAGDNGSGGLSAGSLTQNVGSSLTFAFNLASIAPSAANPISLAGAFNVPSQGSTGTGIIEQPTSGVPSSIPANGVNLYLFQQFTTNQFQSSGNYTLMTVPTSSAFATAFTAGTLASATTTTVGTTVFQAENTSTVDGFNLINPQIESTYALALVPSGALNVSTLELLVSSKVFTASWKQPGGGGWLTGTVPPAADPNWTGTQGDPNGIVDTANFGPYTPGVSGISAPSIINLNGNVTIGNIAFNNSNSYTISATGTESLVMSNGASAATVTDFLGAHTISVPINIPSGLLVTVTNPTDQVTLSGAISGSGGIQYVLGAGTLVLSSPSNTYAGQTIISSSTGNIQLGDGVHVGSLGNTQSVANAGTLTFNQPHSGGGTLTNHGPFTTYTFVNAIGSGNNVNGTGGISQIGTGTLIVLTGSTTYTGTTNVNSLTAIQVGSLAALNFDGPVNDNGLIDVNGQAAGFGALTGNGTIDNVSAGGAISLTVGIANLNTTFAGAIQNTTGTVSLIKQGAGILTLTGTSTYGGSTTILSSGGQLNITASNNILPTGTIFNDNGVNGSLALANGVTLANLVSQNIPAEEYLQVLSGSALETGNVVMPSAGGNQFRIGFSTGGTITYTGNLAEGPSANPATYPGSLFGSGQIFVMDGGTINFEGQGRLDEEGGALFGRVTGATLAVTFGELSQWNTYSNSAPGFGSTTNDPGVSLTINGQAALNFGSGVMNLDTQTQLNVLNFLTLSGGTLTVGGLSYSPASGAASASSVIVSFNGTTIIAGGNSASFMPDALFGNNIFLDVKDGGILFDSNNHNVVIRSTQPYYSEGSGTLVVNGVSVNDGGLTKFGLGQLVFSSAAATQAGNGANDWNGPTNVLGGLLEFNGDDPIHNSAYILVSAGGAVGSSTTLVDTIYTNKIGLAPGAQAGGLALSALDDTVVDTIDFFSAYTGEGGGYNQDFTTILGTQNIFNMRNVDLKSLTAMSIGAISGIGTSGTGNELAAVQFSGTIVPGLNGGVRTYQLGGGGTLNLVASTHGESGGTANNPVAPLVNVSTINGPITTNVLIENGGAVRLTTTNTYTGSTTINGIMVEATPAQAALPSSVTLPAGAPAVPATFQLEQTILSVFNLADGASSIGNSAFATASNLVMNGGVLQYIGTGDVTNRVFSIGTLGATLDNSGSGTINFAATSTEAYLAGTSSTSLTLRGTFGIVAPVGTASVVNVLAGTLVNPATGSLSVVKSGTGAWELTNVLNTYSGGTTVAGGVLQAGGSGIFGSTAGLMTVNTGATLDLNGNNVTVGALSGGGVVDSIQPLVPGTVIFTVGSGNATGTFSGTVNNTSGTVNLVSTGTGTTLLTGNSTYLGTTTIAAGNTLQLGSGGATGSINGASPVLDSGSLVLDQSANVTFANVVSLTGSVTTAGTGTVTFTGSNTYTGGTTISAGATRPGNSNALGTGVVTDNSLLDLNSISLTVGGLAGTGTVDDVSGALTPVLTLSNATATAYTFSGVLQNTTGTVSLVNAAGTEVITSNIVAASLGTAGFAGTVTVSGGTLVLTGTNTYGAPGQSNTTITGGNLVLGAGGTTGSVSGNISDSGLLTINRSDASLAFANNIIAGATPGAVLKTGTGTVTLTGVNTYTGTTTISAGTLVIPAVTAIHANNQIVDNSALIIDAGTKASPVILGTSSVAGITGTGSLTVGVAGTAGYVQLPNGGSATVGSLTINTGSTLDIDAPGTASGKLVVNYGLSGDPTATIRGYLKTAYASGVWTGTGLTSTAVTAEVASVIAAHTGGVYGIGYVDGGADFNQATNALVKAVGNQIIYTPALIGDANLDGSVTFIDLGVVAQNLGKNSDWEHGDFNYDGTVNFLDIGLLAQNLSKSILNTPLAEMIPDPSSALTAQWNLAVAEVNANTQPTDVPEPGMIGLLAVGAGGLLARRRRKA